MKLTDIKPYPANAKKHTEFQIAQIAASIKAFGFRQPIVVDKGHTIIVGHGRYYAAQLLGLKDVPVEVADTLTPEEVTAYRLADNKLNESDWDMALAIPELKGLTPPMLALTGFEADITLGDADWASAFDKETMPKELQGLKQITFILTTDQIQEMLEVLRGIDKDKNVALYQLVTAHAG